MDRGRYVSKGLLVLGTAFWLATGGCGLFDTREANRPSEVTVRCNNPVSPDSVLENIRAHYGKPSVGSCYNPMIDGVFAFHPDPVDANNYPPPNPFVGWNKQVEEGVANYIAADSVKFFQVYFDGEYQTPTVDPGPPQRETRFVEYHILFSRLGQPDTTRYQGRSDIIVEQKVNSLWKIVDWTDHGDGSGLPTWGRLRGDKRVGI